MKRLLFYLSILIVGVVFLLNLAGDKEDVDILQGQEHYGTLILSSEIEGLPIYINEKQVRRHAKKAASFQTPNSRRLR